MTAYRSITARDRCTLGNTKELHVVPVGAEHNFLSPVAVGRVIFGHEPVTGTLVTNG